MKAFIALQQIAKTDLLTDSQHGKNSAEVSPVGMYNATGVLFA